MNPTTVIFDLGGVMLDWNPRYLYQKIFVNAPETMEYFLANVCTQPWNEQHDEGRPFAENGAELKEKFPDYADAIDAYNFRWEEMLVGAFQHTVDIFYKLKQAQVPLYALSNWSAEKFPIALQCFSFLKEFDGIVLSGEVKLKKPDLRIFQHLLDEYQLAPEACVFIDDNLLNVKAAQQMKINTIHFQSEDHLLEDLQKFNLLTDAPMDNS